MTPSAKPSSLSAWRMNSARMALTLARVTQLVSGFSWMRINSGASIKGLFHLHVAEIANGFLMERPVVATAAAASTSAHRRKPKSTAHLMPGVTAVAGESCCQRTGTFAAHHRNNPVDAASTQLDGPPTPTGRKQNAEIDRFSFRILGSN